MSYFLLKTENQRKCMGETSSLPSLSHSSRLSKLRLLTIPSHGLIGLVMPWPRLGTSMSLLLSKLQVLQMRLGAAEFCRRPSSSFHLNSGGDDAPGSSVVSLPLSLSVSLSRVVWRQCIVTRAARLGRGCSATETGKPLW